MMLSAISQKVYEILSQDSVLQGLLPNVKDSSNIWELRIPEPVTQNKFPAVVFKIVSGQPVLGVEALDALSWYIQIDIIDNKQSTVDTLAVFDRIYALLQNANISTTGSKAYQCRLDFFTTDYDNQTLSSFILTRWQILSLDTPSSALSNL